MPTYRFETDCTAIPKDDVEDLQALIDGAREVSYDTLVRRVGRETVKEVFSQYDWSRRGEDLRLKNDWHVRYHVGRYKGRKCYFIVHSAIEYLFCEADGG
jgi:hypothetical protein